MLQETTPVSEVTTAFMGNSRANEKHVQVTITTELKVCGGMLDRVKRIHFKLLVRCIYFQVLKRLAAFAKKRDDVPTRPAIPSTQFGLLYLSK